MRTHNSPGSRLVRTRPGSARQGATTELGPGRWLNITTGGYLPVTDRMGKQVEHDRHSLRARIGALADRSQDLREACTRTFDRALELQSAAAGIRARSLAQRGAALRVAIPRDTTCGAVARRQLEAYLSAWPGGVVFDAKTVASELVNNAYRHGEGTIQLTVRRHDRYVRIDVGDEGPSGAARVQRGKGRRGLEIVDGLSARWGADAGSTHVWAELDLSGRSEPVC